MISLPSAKYKTVVIDPPWNANGYLSQARGPGRNGPPVHKDFSYPLLTHDEIASIDVPSLLEDDALVFLWTINRFVRDAFDLLEAWGLRFLFMMAWHKPNGPKPVGYPQYNMEPILIGKKGKGGPSFLETTEFRTANFWEAPRNYSAAPGAWGRQIVNCTKPEGFYDLLRRVTPGPRLDMFARRRIEGFDAWGDEAPGELD